MPLAQAWGEHAALAGQALEAAKQLRQAVQIHFNTVVKQSSENFQGLFLKSIARQPRGDDGVVVRPGGNNPISLADENWIAM